MVTGDLHNVWEIKALTKKPRREEAEKMLERISKQVQPIMRRHKWRVKVLSEFCPTNLLGLNIGAGVHVKLRLRRPNRDLEFYPFEEVLDTMLHELCHNDIGPHNASFYKLWDELRKECEELMRKGISGTGEGFDLPGRRLGGFSRAPPLSSLSKVSLAAAQERQRIAALSSRGRLGGDKSIMSALTPTQAAAMAAERRLQDDIWCASASGQPVEEEEEEDCFEIPGTSPDPPHSAASSSMSKSIGGGSSTTAGLKRSVENTISGSYSTHRTNFIDLAAPTAKRCCQPAQSSHPQNVINENINACKDGESVTWECESCTFLNPPLAPICGVCETLKPKVASAKYKFWCCKFCTLDNGINLDNCLACGEWRYSHGAPASALAPTYGT